MTRRTFGPLVALFALPLLAAPPVAENPMLVHDDGVLTTQHSSPLAVTPLFSSLVFRATTPATGTELWKSDGSGGGTVLIKDIRRGDGHGVSGEIVPVGSFNAFFAGDDGVHGVELWHTNGTTAGTYMVKDICPGPCDSDPQSLFAFGTSSLFFSAYDPDHGYELWTTDYDGSVDQTYMESDIRPGPDSSNPGGFVAAAGRLYFAADDGTNGRELWKRDTAESPATFMLKNINPGAASSDPHSLVEISGYLYFLANEAGYGVEPWSSNGDGSGTLRMADINPGAGYGVVIDRPRMLYVAGSTVFFVANDGTYGQELWKISLYAASRVTDICSGSCGGAIEVVGVLGTNALFVGTTAAAGQELWKSNGISTSMLANIGPGAANGFSLLLGSTGSVSYFVANDGTNGAELWKTDGTSTSMVRNINPGAANCNCNRGQYLSGWFYFSAMEPATGLELWKTDGTNANTVLVKNIAPDVDGLDPRWIAGIDGNTIFDATTASSGSEPAFSSGLKYAPLLWDLNPGPDPGSPYEFILLGTDFLFGATDGASGLELWRVAADGSATPAIVKDIQPGGESIPEYDTNVNALNFFVADDGVNGRELWVTDGTEPNTKMVRNIASGGTSSNPENLTRVGSTLFFTADDGVNGVELWKSDGTLGGTVIVKDIAALGDSSSPQWLTNVNGTLFFSAHESSAGRELWKSNGSLAGTVRVADIYFGPSGSDPSGLAALGSLLLFFADDGLYGREVWRSNGGAGGAGTNRALDIRSGSLGSDVGSRMVAFGPDVYFSADGGSSGTELYRARDTSFGGMLADICPGACSSAPENLTVAGSLLYFVAGTEANGKELWSTNGVIPGGTVMVSDLEPGTVSSSPDWLHASGNRLYFAAYTSANGRELWELCATPTTGFAVVSWVPTSTVGEPLFLEFQPRDASGATVPCYGGTVHFTSSDPSASLPQDQAISAGSFISAVTATLNTFGAQTITVTDVANPSLTGSVNIFVRHPVTVSVNVAPASTSFPGETVTLTATVTSTAPGTITGNVQFADGGFPIGAVAAVSGGQASRAFSSLTAGEHSFQAFYLGDSNYGARGTSVVPHWRKPAAPANVVAEATSATVVRVTWTPVPEAESYGIYRAGPDGLFNFTNTAAGGGTSQFNDNSAAAAHSYRYLVRAVDSGGYQSVNSNTDIATTVLFTDDALTAGTICKAAHVTQLRTAANALRALANMEAYPFTVTVQAGATITAAAVNELRTAVDQARSTLSLPFVAYTDPVLASGIIIRAAHIGEVRNRVR